MLIVLKIVLNLLLELLSIMRGRHVIGRQRVKTGRRISDPTNRDHTQLDFFDINRK